MPTEIDTPPSPNTFRRALYDMLGGLQYLRAYWGRRFTGGAIGLLLDMLAEGASQAIYARLPGHPEQAPDSLVQVGKDRQLFRFRGETDANWALRVQQVWDDYTQAGTPQQLLHVINQWGHAGWPASWIDLTSANLVESAHTSFTFTLTIPFGNINPPWLPWLVGAPGITIGMPGLYVGIGVSTDIETLIYLVRKWKPARSKGFATIYYSVSGSVTFTVGQGGF